MANEIQTISASGRTLYALVRNASAQVWNGATSLFETYTVGDYANYAVTLTEQPSTGYYVGSFPSTITAAGTYNIDVRWQQGGSVAATDAAVSFGTLLWSGSGQVTLGSPVNINMSQAVPTSNTAQTLGDALNAARVQAFGKWTLSGVTLILYNSDNTVARTFTLDNALAPTLRT